MRVYKLFLFGLTILLITACSVEPVALPTSTPLPSVQIQVDPIVEWLRPAMQTCSQQIPERNWILLSTETPLVAEVESTVQIYWGSTTSPSKNTYQITSDTLQVAVNPALAIRELSNAKMQAIFTGKISQWNEIAENLPDAEIQLWLYPQSFSIMENFSQWSGLSPQSLSALAFLAPHPLQMRKNIVENPSAIGILTTQWSNEQVTLVNIEGDQNVREFPVLAELTVPDPYVQEWLFCIQKQIGQ
ncbi:hypothetical protein BECAL_01570 [Bellilinea caldifistulae]|uniref:PBP domain-containing protein n=1 Tax=Bellilinea caldifistulae TaxID=360411 RepID=A0A0P6XPT3_9CHLR|nr:substrate-binding domain-containing protein [Bellilinea caldifistulae]KPL74214.1 hypothetical protein AC812_12945 [Bellilinea caldifistulae]GAP10403.1 hypothetical protein BECAL_01570 [Bellilinea caldifistulae]